MNLIRSVYLPSTVAQVENTESGMQVAIYARHSSDKQSRSAEDQIARCERWCEKNGYTVVGIFIDEAISGASMSNRPGLHELIEAALLSDFAKIVVEDLSRISRDLEDVAAIYKKMAFLDIRIVSLTEGEINELHIGLKGTMNALYLKDLSDKTLRGVIASALKGRIPGGKTYGYDQDHRPDGHGLPQPGFRKINIEEAAVVRRIFHEYQTGKLLTEICEGLNADCIPSPKGKRWHSTVLCGTASRQTGILRQSLYKGEVTFNKLAYKKHPITGKRVSIVKPESEWIRIPAPELAILPEEEFDAIQAQLEERSHRLPAVKEEIKERRQARARQVKARHRKLRLVTGNLWCAEHDKPIVSIRAGLHGCPVMTCRSRNYRRELMVELVQQAMRSVKVDDLRVYQQGLGPKIDEIDAEIAALDAEEEGTVSAIHNIMRAFESDRPGRDARLYLKDRQRHVARIRKERSWSIAKREKLQPLDDRALDEIMAKYEALIDQHVQDPDNEVTTEILHGFIMKAVVTTTIDMYTGEKHPSVRTELDFSAIIGALKSTGHD